jgi:hypothetical protein
MLIHALSVRTAKLTLTAMGGCLIVLAGCRSATEKPPAARPISLAEFAGQPDDPVAVEPAVATDPHADATADPAAPGDAVRIKDPGTEPVRRRAVRTMAPGEPVVIDSMVGQINGRPVFADEFFETIEDRLIAVAEEEGMTSRQFTAQASQIVMTQLQQVVFNALFIAEAESDLTPEEKVGIRYWLNTLEEKVVAGHGGVRGDTERDLAREGQTVEGKLAEMKDQALITKLIEEKIRPRVIVSWRDIQREYESEKWQQEFCPPGRITLSRIRLLTERQAEQITRVAEQLGAGTTFAEVARSLNQPNDGVWQTFEVGPAGVSDINFENEALQAQLQQLQVEGDTVGPFELGSTTWWLHLTSIERPQHRDLYDPEVQRVLERYLRQQRGTEEQNRYIQTLLEDGIHDDLESMAERLVVIAVMRYGPS